MRKSTNIALQMLLAISCVTAAIASCAAYAEDRASRLRAERFGEEYQLLLRRPEIVASLQFAPSGDYAADLVADATLRDVVVPVNLNGLAPDVRAAWLDAVARYDEQMADATALSLDALAQRPGWPYHASLIGQLTYTSDVRALSADLIDKHARWSTPLYAAAVAAGFDQALWQSLAVAYVQTWPVLSSAHSATAPQVFRNAFVDPDFLGRTLGPTMQVLGKEATLASIPDSPPALREAFRQLVKNGDVEAGWELHCRWDAAEWRSRVNDLQQVEVATKSGDVDRLRRLCNAWASAHSVWDYDSPSAHAQAARLLEAWPLGIRGSWSADRRANITRYLLAGRLRSGSPVLITVVNDLDRVPEPVRAEAQLLSGDFSESWRLATAAPDFGASNEWTHYLVTAVRHLTSTGQETAAREVIAQLPSMLRGGCSERTMRIMVESSSSAISAANREQMLTLDEPLVVCATGAEHASYILPMVERPVVVNVLYDGARRTSLLLRPGVVRKIAFDHQSGAHTLLVRSSDT